MLWASLLAPAVQADVGSRGGASLSVTSDDNVTRGEGAGNVLADRFVTMNLQQSVLVPLTEHTRMAVTGFGGVNAYLDYQGLSNLYLGVQGEWQYRTSGEFGAPIYSLFARATADSYNSKLRDGYRYAAGLSARKPLTDQLEVFAAAAYNLRDARSIVFDTQDLSVRANLDWQATRRDTFYLGLEYRNGDIVSTALPAFNYVSIATAVAPDDAFDDAARFAYRMDGTTYLGTLGVNHAFGEGHSLDFSWRYASATPTSLNGYASGDNIRYTVNQFTLAYLVRF